MKEPEYTYDNHEEKRLESNSLLVGYYNNKGYKDRCKIDVYLYSDDDPVFLPMEEPDVTIIYVVADEIKENRIIITQNRDFAVTESEVFNFFPKVMKAVFEFGKELTDSSEDN